MCVTSVLAARRKDQAGRSKRPPAAAAARTGAPTAVLHRGEASAPTASGRTASARLGERIASRRAGGVRGSLGPRAEHEVQPIARASR